MTAVGPSGDPMIKVWNRRQNKWIPYDTYAAIDEMLEEHGQAIRNLPDEVDPKPSKETMKKIEFEYNRQNHKSAELVRDMNDLATIRLRQNFYDPRFEKCLHLL